MAVSTSTAVCFLVRHSAAAYAARMALPRIDVVVDAAGRGEVRVNGDPVEGVYALEVQAAVGELTTLTLHLRGDVQLHGDGVVHLVEPVDDVTGTVADLLDSIDAEDVERRALDSVTLGAGPAAVTREVLRIVAGTVREAGRART